MTTLEIHLSAWLLLGKPPATFLSAIKGVAGKEGATAHVQQEESFITAKLIHSTRGGPVTATGARGQVCGPTRSRAHVTPTHQSDCHVPPEAPPTRQFRQQLRHFLYLRFLATEDKIHHDDRIQHNSLSSHARDGCPSS